ncbi:MAG: hypothetical protein V7780_09740 [Colwellia sp.]
MSLLTKLVNLYRNIGFPRINSGGTLEVKGVKLSEAICLNIITIWEDDNNSDVDVEISIGQSRYSNINDSEALKNDINKEVRVLSIALPRQGKHQFYLNITDFISRTNSLNFGEIPKDYYIVEGDILRKGTPSHKKTEEIIKIEHFCKFIKLIRKTCDFEDSNSGPFHKAIFVVSDENSNDTLPKSIELEFSTKLLSLENINISLLEEIINADKKSTHRTEKLSVFRIALWDALRHAQKDDSDIYFLATHWEDILENYESSYSLYIKGYCFNKFKKEIEDFRLDSISKANNLIGDIAVKTLVIPSIFAIWLMVLRSPRFDEIFNLGISFLSTFAAVVIILTIDNQQYLVKELLETSKRTLDVFERTPSVFGSYSKKDTNDVDELIASSKTRITKRLGSIKSRLIGLRVSIWLFTLTIAFITSALSWPYETSICWPLAGIVITTIIWYLNLCIKQYLKK